MGEAAFSFAASGDWPRCFYDSTKWCGEPSTREVNAGPSDINLVRRGWHVADMCDCPSCPVRCAIRQAMALLAEPEPIERIKCRSCGRAIPEGENVHGTNGIIRCGDCGPSHLRTAQ